MVTNIDTEKGQQKYTKAIKGKENVLKLQEKALSLNEQKQKASAVKEDKISDAKRLALVKKADKTELAKLVNKGLFGVAYPICKNKKLTLKDIEEINLGGAIVGVLVYYIPNFNFEHPIVVLISRGIATFLKVRTVCEGIINALKKERKSESTTTAGGEAKGYGRNEQSKEKDYIEAGRVIDGLIEEVQKK